jgi:hypothetical protein
MDVNRSQLGLRYPSMTSHDLGILDMRMVLTKNDEEPGCCDVG